MLVFDINRFGTKREIDDNGYLRVSSCNITKSQIRPYYGREIPGWRDFDLDPDTIYNVYCPEEELKKALESFNNLPLTREHIEVDVENVPKDKIVGSLGDRAEYKKPYVKNSLIVYDKKDIDWILSGKKKELSCGYRYTPVRQSGEFDGKHYDFVMTDIIGNHVALVREGRAGHDVMVADSVPFVEEDHPRNEDGTFKEKGSENETKTINGSSINSKSFKEKVDLAFNDELPKREQLIVVEKLGGPFEKIKDLAGKKLLISQGVLFKVGSKENKYGKNHDIPIDVIKKMPNLVAEPAYITKSKSEGFEHRYVIITKQKSGVPAERLSVFVEPSNPAAIVSSYNEVVNIHEEKESGRLIYSSKENAGPNRISQDMNVSNVTDIITQDSGNVKGEFNEEIIFSDTNIIPQEEGLSNIFSVDEEELPNFTESQNDNTINTKENEMLANDEFKEADHPRDKDGKFTTAGSGSSAGSTKSEKLKSLEEDLVEANKRFEAFKKEPQTEENRNDRFMAAKEVEMLQKAIEHEKSLAEGSEKKEESSKETAVEKMYKKLSEQGMKGEALEQAIYEKHGWEGVEEARMISEYESGNPKHSQKEQEELVKSLEEELGDYKKIVKNFEDQGETGIDYNHYKQMVERQEGALKQAKSQLDWIKRHTKKEMAKDKEIPEKAGKPEKAGDEVALNQGETKMAEEVKEAPAEKKVEETKKEEVVEDACKKAEDKKEVKPACDEKEDKRKLIDEIGGILKGKLDDELLRTVLKKAEELAYNDSERSADDEKKDDLKGKEKEAFAEGVDFGEKKEKAEPKKLDSEHESEGMKKAEKEMAKDSALAMDIDAIKAQVREEVMADFKAREEARKAVRGFVGDVNVMAFDSAEDIYKFACGKSGMDLNEIVSFKDAFKGLSAGKSKALALDASPVSGSNEECLKDIRIA